MDGDPVEGRGVADALCDALGGTAAPIRTEAGWPAFAIALGGRHPLLVRDHQGSVTVSLPVDRSWWVRTRGELTAALPEITAATAAHRAGAGAKLSLADALVALEPMLARAAPGDWRARIPGTPVPTETWWAQDRRSLGVLLRDGRLIAVVWVGLRSYVRTLSRPTIGRIEPWLARTLALQAEVLAAEAAEEAREAALPLPTLDEVRDALRAGARITVGVSRSSETWFMDGGRLRHEIFDEGATWTEDVSERRLREGIEWNARQVRRQLDAFRRQRDG